MKKINIKQIILGLMLTIGFAVFSVFIVLPLTGHGQVVPAANEVSSVYSYTEEIVNLVEIYLEEETESQEEAKLEEYNYEPIQQETAIRSTSINDILFVGEGRRLDIFDSNYHRIFAHRLHNIPGFLGRLTDRERSSEWFNQFDSMGGSRNGREAHLLTYIEETGLTKEDMIRSMEINFDRTIYKIDALINWSRYGIYSPLIGDTDEIIVALWRNSFSLARLDALFSNDIYQIWEHFGGNGVLHNGMAFSPEWIVNNIEKALVEKQIPVEEVLRVLEYAYNAYAIYSTELTEILTEAVYDFSKALETLNKLEEEVNISFELERLWTD